MWEADGQRAESRARRLPTLTFAMSILISSRGSICLCAAFLHTPLCKLRRPSGCTMPAELVKHSHLLGASATALNDDRCNDHNQHAGNNPDDHISVHKRFLLPSMIG